MAVQSLHHLDFNHSKPAMVVLHQSPLIIVINLMPYFHCPPSVSSIILKLYDWVYFLPGYLLCACRWLTPPTRS